MFSNVEVEIETSSSVRTKIAPPDESCPELPELLSVELFPVTGQTLPLISSGGTSIWMTCLALGIVLSVSAKREVEKNEQQAMDNPLDILSQTL